MKFIYCILCVAMISLAAECNSNQNSDNMKDKIVGEVKDFSDLDGCGYLIVLEDGKKLQPGEIVDENWEWKDGQKIVFSYEPMPDMMSICMAGEIVKITAIELKEKG